MTDHRILNEKMIQASVDGIGMIDAGITRLENEAGAMREARDHLMMLGKLNGVSVECMAEACGISVQAVYQAIARASRA